LQTSSKSLEALLTTGIYSQDTLLGGMERMARVIFYQEQCYPRPHQIEPYGHFKNGYLTTVDAILNEFATTSQNDQSGCTSPGASGVIEDVLSAERGFFREFEKLDEAKLTRESRMTRA